MRIINFNNAVEFISNNNESVNEVKITKFERTGFNEMEGDQLSINIKLITIDKYKNKLFTMLTNSTYMEDFEGATYDDVKEELQEYLNIIAMG